jgi:hypothetical protein
LKLSSISLNDIPTGKYLFSLSLYNNTSFVYFQSGFSSHSQAFLQRPGGKEVVTSSQNNSDNAQTTPKPHHFLRLIRVYAPFNMNTVEFLAEIQQQQQQQQQQQAEEMSQLPQVYVEWLARRRTTPTVIRLPYVLNYNNVSSSTNSTSLPKLYGVQLHVITTSLYSTVPSLLQFPLLVPSTTTFMHIQPPLLSSSSVPQAHFPQSYPLTIALIPRCPLPTTFDVRVSYNTQEESGVCDEGSIGLFHVSFSDLFLPITLPPSYTQQVSDGFFVCCVFSSTESLFSCVSHHFLFV